MGVAQNTVANYTHVLGTIAIFFKVTHVTFDAENHSYTTLAISQDGSLVVVSSPNRTLWEVGDTVVFGYKPDGAAPESNIPHS